MNPERFGDILKQHPDFKKFMEEALKASEKKYESDKCKDRQGCVVWNALDNIYVSG